MMSSSSSDDLPSIIGFEVIEKIGEGAYGVVYKGKQSKSQNIMALKEIKYGADGAPSTAIREISLLKELAAHPNILHVDQIVLEDQRLYIVMELCVQNMYEMLQVLPKEIFLEPLLIKSYLYQLIQGVCFCHQRAVMHGDLKPENILIDYKGFLKVADFGLAQQINKGTRLFSQKVVTLAYRAPEVMLGPRHHSMPVDIWSIGCIFAEMAMKNPLFQESEEAPARSEYDQLVEIFKILGSPTKKTWPEMTDQQELRLAAFPKWRDNKLATSVKNISPDGIELLQSMLIYDPANRVTAKKMLDHRFFDDLDKSTLPAAHMPTAPVY